MLVQQCCCSAVVLVVLLLGSEFALAYLIQFPKHILLRKYTIMNPLDLFSSYFYSNAFRLLRQQIYCKQERCNDASRIVYRSCLSVYCTKTLFYWFCPDVLD
uniref:RxLR effector candidate protein n=1 Tax=Hyaloperonospora arabidopsidis (strain Emoy2) TaxID=559515 RepID=A0A090B920_HYAAE|nr:RxLR effector candidate protein [Hyaloperonospora arabidopsidis Emoy2]